MVATAARAPSISRRMKPTSSKSGATQAGVSSLRFRRAIGRSEAGGASKTFAHGKGPPQIAQRETHILKSGLALRHRLEDEGPDLISECVFLAAQRSEEHTSELQSPCNLVCRLLLEKKKKE